MSANSINLDGDNGDGDGDGDDDDEDDEEDDCDIVDFIDSEYSHDLSNEDYDDDEENYEDIQNEIHLHKMLSLIDHLVLEESDSYWNEQQIPLTAMLPVDLLKEIRVWRKKFQKQKQNHPDPPKSSSSNENANRIHKKQPIIMQSSKNYSLPANSYAKTLPKLTMVKNNNAHKHIERVSFSLANELQRGGSKQLTLPPLSIPQKNRYGRELSAGQASFQSRIMIEKKVSFTMKQLTLNSGNSYFLESTTIKSSSLSSSNKQIPMQSSLNRINSLRTSLTSYNNNSNNNQDRSGHFVAMPNLLNNNNKLIRLPTLNPNGQGKIVSTRSINFNHDDDDDGRGFAGT